MRGIVWEGMREEKQDFIFGFRLIRDYYESSTLLRSVLPGGRAVAVLFRALSHAARGTRGLPHAHRGRTAYEPAAAMQTPCIEEWRYH